MDCSNFTPLRLDEPPRPNAASSNVGAFFIDGEPEDPPKPEPEPAQDLPENGVEASPFFADDFAPSDEKDDDVIVDASPEPFRDKLKLDDDFEVFDDEEENEESKNAPRRARRPSKRANAVARYVWGRFLERVPARQIAREIGMSHSATLQIIKRVRTRGFPEKDDATERAVRCPVCGYETPPPCSVCEARRRGVPFDAPDDAFDEREFDLNLRGGVLKRYLRVRREKEKTFEKRSEKFRPPQKRGRKPDAEKYRWG